MRARIISLASVSFVTVLSGCAVLQPADVASGFTSHLLCSETFVSNLDPDRVYDEHIKKNVTPMRWLLSYNVDRSKREVKTTIGGAFESRAVYRDGMGCLLLRGDGAMDSSGIGSLDLTPAGPALLPPIADDEIVDTKNVELRAALDRAFAEPASPAQRRTRAVVVVHDGKIIAERYATGVGVDTPLLSFSVAKSVTNALVGILVRQGKLSIQQPAPLPVWRDAADPRHAITIDNLLRQTSGLALTQTNSGFDPTSRMSFIERDMAGFAQRVGLEAKPGSRWAYTDGNFMLLSRIIRDAAGGTGRDVIQLARQELFAPLGMRNVTIEFDATGTPLGAAYMFASARDWARFGLLYLNDGMIGGKRILPEGWVRYSTSQTLDTGYGAGFFLNVRDGVVPEWGAPWGMAHLPRDTFFARGFMQQFIVVVPSERLVVARFSGGWERNDTANTDQLIADVIAALHRAK